MTFVCAACVAFLAGVGWAHSGVKIELALVWAVLFAAFAVLRRKNVAALVLLTLAVFLIGWQRGGVYMQRLEAYKPLIDQKVTLIGRASIDGVYNTKSQFVFTLVNAKVDGQPLTGNIYVTGFGVAAVYHGDEVRATGKLRSGFGSFQASMSYASLEVVKSNTSVVDGIRRKFAAGMQSALPEPLASFGMGLLIGQRNTLPKEVSNQLLMVGLTHIIAVSGYNLTILLRAAKRLLNRGSKFQTVVASVAFIGLFLLFTGSSPSIVRAAIVSLLSLAAWYYGRNVKPLVLLLVAAVITIYANPLYLWGDASWYLSFLAFYGVLVLAPMLRTRLPARIRNAPLILVALESLCAEIMAMPYILFTFGQMSFIGLVANVLVVTLIPLAMLLSFVAGLAGMLILPVAGWFAWPARWLLTYMLDVANLLSHIPHIFVENLGLSVVAMCSLYAAVAAVTVMMRFKTKPEYVTITDKEL